MLDRSPLPTTTAPGNLDRLARAYVEAFRMAGVARLIANLSTRVELRQIGGRLVPITINDGEPGETSLCSPRLAHARWAREELRTIIPRWRFRCLRSVVGAMDGWLRRAAFDRVVHLSNWMLPTNLIGDLAIPYPGTLTRDLAAEFPDHLLAIRSLNEWTDAALMDALTQAGWILVPNRQIWVIEDLEVDWAPKHNSVLDRSFFTRQIFVRDDFAEMTAADSHTVARLYEQSFLGDFDCEPAYTPSFFRIAHAIGLIHYIGFRDPADGSLAAVAGFVRVEGVAALTLVGYDPRHQHQQSLYRLAVHAFLEDACALGLRVNLASGAGDFKRRRGARPQLEYTAFYLAHLPQWRQRPVLWLKWLLDHAGWRPERRFRKSVSGK